MARGFPPRRSGWLVWLGTGSAIVIGGVILLISVLIMSLAGPFVGDHGRGNKSIENADGIPAEYVQLITDAANDAGCEEVTPALLAAQLHQESGFNPQARSPVGAMGIAQFMPATWACTLLATRREKRVSRFGAIILSTPGAAPSVQRWAVGTLPDFLNSCLIHFFCLLLEVHSFLQKQFFRMHVDGIGRRLLAAPCITESSSVVSLLNLDRCPPFCSAHQESQGEYAARLFDSTNLIGNVL